MARFSRWRLPTERLALGRGSSGRSNSAEQARRGRRWVVLALELGEQLEVLARGQAAVVSRPLRRPADRHARPPLDRAPGRRSPPARRASNVDFPAPFGPSSATDLAPRAPRGRRLQRNVCSPNRRPRAAARPARGAVSRASRLPSEDARPSCGPTSSFADRCAPGRHASHRNEAVTPRPGTGRSTRTARSRSTVTKLWPEPRPRPRLVVSQAPPPADG